MPIFKENEVVLLLGAGASKDAGIPHSDDMVAEIEHLIEGSDDAWNRYRSLYNYLKSAVFFADGLDGLFGRDVHFNIERLVNTLDELLEKERHPLYPFVGAWNPKLVEVAGPDFRHIQELRAAIVGRLRNQWLELPDFETASYYRKLLEFQRSYGFPLRVFSLNYDLCVEKTCGYDKVERGFQGRQWVWQMLDETNQEPRPIQLYKLHGSTDWELGQDGRVTFYDSHGMISSDDTALLFGTSYKLQYVDPFLFLAYEFRRWTLEARLIVAIGYGFGDEHINGILGQALNQDRARKLLAVAPLTAPCEVRVNEIAKILNVKSLDQVNVSDCLAKDFFDGLLNLGFLTNLFPQEPDLMPIAPLEETSSGDNEPLAQ